ncbi:MAG: L(+)-tartrate dehydratase subunit alpha [Clostridia bacterium]
MDYTKKLEEVMTNFISTVAINLPQDVLSCLEDMKQNETNVRANKLYDCMFDNIDKASISKRPLCQDTGILQFFIKVGTHNKYIDILENTIKNSVVAATKATPLRPNAIEFFEDKNTGNNCGSNTPLIEYELVPNSDILEIQLYLAGGGCSLPGRAKVLYPLEGYKGIVDYVMDTVIDLGVNACPPLIVGVGLSCCAPTAGMLSKKALLRNVGIRNENKKAALLETQLINGLNEVGIGPMGLMGDKSVLDVHIEYATHHPATLAVGVSVGCWATRRGKIIINNDLSYNIVSHREVK